MPSSVARILNITSPHILSLLLVVSASYRKSQWSLFIAAPLGPSGHLTDGAKSAVQKDLAMQRCSTVGADQPEKRKYWILIC